MRPAPAALAVVLALPVTAALAHVEVKPERAPAGAETRLTFEVPNERSDATTTRIAIQPAEQEQPPAETQTSAPSEPAKDSGDDEGGVPIWAGIGLILLAAIAGSAAARARNRRRMRDYTSGDR